MDLYQIFGMRREDSPTEEQIKREFRIRVAQLHPDKGGQDVSAFDRLVKAYNVLIDPQKRADYDGQFRPFVSVPDLFARNFKLRGRLEAELTQPRAAKVRGKDVAVLVKVSVSTLQTGGIVKVSTPWISPGNVEVEVPPADGMDFRVCTIVGKGRPGRNAGANGDLMIVLISNS